MKKTLSNFDLNTGLTSKLFVCIILGLLSWVFVRYVQTANLDFEVYYNAGQSLLYGRTDFYSATFAISKILDYRYPPFFLFLFLPLWLLPYFWSNVLWGWLNLTAIFLATIAIKRGLELITNASISVHLILILSFITVIKYLLLSLKNQNVNLIMFCLVFGAFYLLLKKKNISASLLFALAICFKVIPLLLLPYFAIRKKWKFLSFTIIFVIFFNLIPAIYLGFNNNLKTLKNWYEHVVVNTKFHDTQGPINLSLKGHLKRHLVEIDYAKNIYDSNYRKVNVISLDEGLVNKIWMVLAFVLYAGTLAVIWTNNYFKKKTFSPESEIESSKFSDKLGSSAYCEFGLMICIVLIISPRTNALYFIALFFPLTALLTLIFTGFSKVSIFSFCLIFSLICLLPLIPGSQISRLFTVLGVDFYVTLILWLTLLLNFIKIIKERNLVTD